MAAHLTGIYSAIKMLNGRIKIVHQYLLAMQRGWFGQPLRVTSHSQWIQYTWCV